MAQITFSDIASFVNYSRSTQIEPAPWRELKGRWQLHKAAHIVHTSKYPFTVLYFFSETSQDQMTQALQDIPATLLPDLHIVYPETQARHIKKVTDAPKWQLIKHKWSTREFLLSFIKVELDAYLDKLRKGNPKDYIDPPIETPCGFDRKVPNPVFNYLVDAQTTSVPLNGTLAIVLAEAGQGKTYMSRHLVGQLAETYSTVFPIFVASSQWRGLTLDDQRSPFKTITHSFRHFGAAINWVEGHEEEFLKITLSADIFRIVFDGFDEFVLRNRGEAQPTEVLEALATLARDTGSRIIITSRTSFWDTNLPEEAQKFVEKTHCYHYLIKAFDANHAANYFRKNLTKKPEQDRALDLFRRLMSESKDLTGRGFVLNLLADLVQKDSRPDHMPAAADGTLAWLLYNLCERETLRQQLPFDAQTQLQIFKTFAKEIAEGAAATTSFLRLCMQTVCESLHLKNIEQALEAFKSHPLLRKPRDQDTWAFSQEQIMIGLLALQIHDWNELATKAFLEKATLEPERIHDLGSLAVDLLGPKLDTNAKAVRVRQIIEKLSIGWRDAFQPGYVIPEGRRLAGVIALLAVERLLPQGSSHRERAQMLLSLCGDRAISNLFLSGTISRYDFKGMTIDSCLFDRVTWINCDFDDNTVFQSCKFHGGVPAERCTGLGGVKRIGCKLDPEAETVFASAEVAEGRRAYSTPDLRTDVNALLTKFIIPGGVGLKTIARQHLEKGSFGHSKYRREILDVFKSLVIEEHHLRNTDGFHIRESAEEAVKFYASNNVLTGPLDDAFTRLSRKLLKK
jgi:hypothetical protein